MKKFICFTTVLVMMFMVSGVYANQVVKYPSAVNNNVNKSNVNVRSMNTQNQGQTQGQVQTQTQSQAQAQLQNNNQNISPTQTTSVYNVQERELLAAPEVNPISIPIIQNGRIGDMTSEMPRFANKGLTKLNKEKDVIVHILKVYTGGWFTSVRLEDLEVDLMEQVNELDQEKIEKGKVRYSVKYKDSASSNGIGGGVASSVSSNGGLDASTGSILPGYHDSTANPKFIITFYEVE